MQILNRKKARKKYRNYRRTSVDGNYAAWASLMMVSVVSIPEEAEFQTKDHKQQTE